MFMRVTGFACGSSSDSNSALQFQTQGFIIGVGYESLEKPMATMTATLQSNQEFSWLPLDKYRGAVVEDLQLPPAFALPETEPISRVMELAYERDFSHIPNLTSGARVLDRNRKPLGYVDVARLKESGADPHDPVSKHMTKFKRTSSHPYSLITVSTPLAELEEFLKTNIFALVTDSGRKFVLAVATSHDLENFVSRRGT